MLEEVPRAIKRAGFVPADMHLQARGRYSVDAGTTTASFRIRGWKRAFKVRTGSPLAEGEILLRAAVDYTGSEVVLGPPR